MDPLKPLSNLIRSLGVAGSKARVDKGSSSASGAAEGANADGAAQSGTAAIRAIEHRLHARLASLVEWDQRRAREIFVECVLASEFGSQLVDDPAFAELVQSVSATLAAEPVVTSRIDVVLREMVARNTPPDAR